MRYLDSNMQAGEKIVYSAQLHWIVYHFGVSMTIIGGLFKHYSDYLVRFIFGDEVANLVSKPLTYVALGIIAIGALHLVFGFIRQISTELVITNKRVIAKHGLISITTFEVMLGRVEGANIDQTITGRLLGFGTVMVKGTGGGISPIDHVANPQRFHIELMKIMEFVHQSEGGNIGRGD